MISILQSICWDGSCLILLNQALLPTKVEYIHCHDFRVVAEAIKRLEVRGAPAIGAAAAFGLFLGAKELVCVEDNADFFSKLLFVANEIKQTRPTAVNLSWAVDRMMTISNNHQSSERRIVLQALEAEAIAIAQEDREMNVNISSYGAELFTTPGTAVLTHCNAGALATVAQGTALGVIRRAWANGMISKVFADETRPLLQGARLTALELMQDNIPVTLITDNMAGWVMKNNMVQAVIVGADRIALNGDVANKIGTYSVAVLAKEHNIPFYVAAPTSTFDFSIRTGDEIPIEERHSSEVTTLNGVRTAPEGVEVFNPAFDVTPNHLVSAIITEHGVLTAPYEKAIIELKERR